MTGFGEALRQADSVAVAVELRAVNSRYFKLNVRLPEGYSALEAHIETMLRQHIKRGTVQVQLQIDLAHAPDDYRIDRDVLAGYFQQLQALAKAWNISQPVSLDSLLVLPGVVIDASISRAHASEAWPIIEDALGEALSKLNQMRAEEGAALAADMAASCQTIAERLDEIEGQAPLVVEGYRRRLTDRVSKALEELNVHLNPEDLIREVSLFSERSDISEELVRLRSHLDQFHQTMALADSSGRKLEFLSQEMFREANTIGAKANNVEIARHVVEIKTAIERVREQVQNVE
jgi:uncharacterized protein (TIGR00255 family)